MKNIFSSIIFSFVLISGFAQASTDSLTVNPNDIQKDFATWFDYQNTAIMLSSDFVPLDENSNIIKKETFLNELLKGTYIPISLKSEDSILNYKLFRIESSSDSSIKASISEIAFNELQNLKKEGEQFPKFSFKDINGSFVTNETMKGKIVVIKCWYIHCASCIKEFPEVNKLVEIYKNRSDIYFLSLAEDNVEQLKTFLTKKPLFYSVIPNMKVYMNETLQLNAFPTHFIIDKEGKIIKVLSDYKSLEVALSKVSKL